MPIFKLRPFSAGAFHKNEQNLNRLSREGLQLQKAGWLRYGFEQSPIIYRHVLDYCPLVLGEDELDRRKKAFEAAGWELVDTTVTGWRFFRRPWEEALPESAYESPCPRTDAEARKIAAISALFWIRVPVLAAGAVLALLAIIRGKGMAIPALVFLLIIVVLSFRMQALQEQLKP